jgi:phi13 family phage major tail protein
MAGIGLRYCAYAPLTENESAGTYTYGTGKRGRKMLNANIKLNFAEATLYGDDSIGEYAKEFIDGDITIGQDELTNTMKVDLLGNSKKSITVNGETIEEVTSKDSDNPPLVGFGYIQTKMIDKVRQYHAKFYKKVQFSEPDESAETKGQSISWQTPALIGKIMRTLDGSWREEILTASLDTAIEWLATKLNLPPVTTLKTLVIGALELTPAFSHDVVSYAATTTNASDIIVATPTDPDAIVSIDLNEGTTVVSGAAATWSEGENTVVITVTNGSATKDYTITVTKE